MVERPSGEGAAGASRANLLVLTFFVEWDKETRKKQRAVVRAGQGRRTGDHGFFLNVGGATAGWKKPSVEQWKEYPPPPSPLLPRSLEIQRGYQGQGGPKIFEFKGILYTEAKPEGEKKQMRD